MRLLWGECPQLAPLGHAADCNGVSAVAWVDRYEKGKELRVPYVEDDRRKMDYGEGVMTQLTVALDVATDNTDEDANLAEARTGVELLDENKVLRGTCRGRHADEEWDMVTQAYYNLVQDVPHFVIFVFVGFGAACALARAVHRLTPMGPTTEFDNFEDLMFKKRTSTATGEIGLVAGAHFSRVNWRAVYKYKGFEQWWNLDSTIDFFVSPLGLVACRFADGAVSGQQRGELTFAKYTVCGFCV